MNGEEILRDAEALHLRLATVINHQAMIEKRELARQAICTSKINKMNEANEEHRQKSKANEAAVCQVLKAAEEEGRLRSDCSLSDKANFEYCTLDDFAKLRVPLLKAFILAHNHQIKLVKDIPNKGNVKEVVEHGAHNAISMVYKCRMKPNLLLGKLPHSAADLDKARGDGGTLEDLHVTTVRIGDPDHVKPSVLLEGGI